MKKLISLILSAAMTVMHMSFFTKVGAINNTVDNKLGKEIVTAYLQNNNLSSISSIYNEFLGTNEFLRSATSFGIQTGKSLAVATRYLTDSETYRDEIDVKYTDAANALFMAAVNNAELDSMNLCFVDSDVVMATAAVLRMSDAFDEIDFDGIFYGYDNSYDTSDRKYIKEAVNTVFPVLHNLCPALSKSGKLDALKKKLLQNATLDSIGKTTDIYSYFEKLVYYVTVYETVVEHADYLAQKVDEDTSLGMGVERMKKQLDKEFAEYFSDVQLINGLDGSMAQKLAGFKYGTQKPIAADEVTEKAVSAANTIVIDIMLDTPDICAVYTYDKLVKYTLDYSVIVSAQAQKMKSADRYTENELLQFSVDNLSYFNVLKTTLIYGRKLAIYNKNYGTTFIENRIAACEDMIEKFEGYVDVLIENGANIPSNMPSGSHIPGAVPSNRSLPEGIYNIVSSLNNGASAIDISGQGKNDGTNVHLWTRHNGNSQKFEVRKLSGNVYTIKNVNSGKMLDISGSSEESCANVCQWTHNAGESQKWVITPSYEDDCIFSISSYHSGMYLDVSNGFHEDGTNIWVYDGNSTPAQCWIFVKVSDLDGTSPDDELPPAKPDNSDKIPQVKNPYTAKSCYYNDEKIVISWEKAEYAKQYEVIVKKADEGITVRHEYTILDNTALYNLRPGTYNYYIRAMNGDLSTKSAVKSFNVVERPAKKWSDWSGWSTTPVKPSDTVQVETKTQYGYYHYLMTWTGTGNTGAYPLPLREIQQCFPNSGVKNEEYHEVWYDSEVERSSYDVTYYNYTTNVRKTCHSYINTHCSSRIGAMNRLYFLGTRTVYRYRVYE